MIETSSVASYVPNKAKIVLIIIRHQNSIFCVIQNCVSAIDTLAGYTWVVKLTANFFKALKAARFLAGNFLQQPPN